MIQYYFGAGTFLLLDVFITLGWLWIKTRMTFMSIQPGSPVFVSLFHSIHCMFVPFTLTHLHPNIPRMDRWTQEYRLFWRDLIRRVTVHSHAGSNHDSVLMMSLFAAWDTQNLQINGTRPETLVKNYYPGRSPAFSTCRSRSKWQYQFLFLSPVVRGVLAHDLGRLIGL